jgi:hypothetical protein
MKYDLLTLDTQAFNKNSFDFEGPWLSQLKQFKDGATKVVISEVVVRELVRQLADKIRQAKDEFEASTKKALLYGLDAKAAADLTLLKGKPRALAEARVKAYLDTIGAVEIPANQTDIDQVLDAYFKPAPPFASSGKKKSEFPDAIALLSMENWAEKLGKRILAVSADGDWTAFADRSLIIDTVDTIDDALALLSAHAEEARELLIGKLAEIDDEASETAKVFRGLLETELENVTVFPDYSSSQPADIDSGELSLIGFYVAGDAPDYAFDVIQVGSDTLAASVDLRVKAKVSAEVNFSVWDSIDDEMIPMGSVTVEREVDDLEATVIVTWHYSAFDEAWELTSVELGSIEDPDLGYVEMDWGDQEQEVED